MVNRLRLRGRRKTLKFKVQSFKFRGADTVVMALGFQAGFGDEGWA